VEQISFVPIGFVESDFKEIQDDPGIFQGTTAVIRILDEYADGLFRLESYKRLYVIYAFDRAEGYRLVLHPRGDKSRPERGVFATRAPYRPNPIGLTVVELLSIEGNTLTVRNLDAIDGTPVLDIKPWKNDYYDRGEDPLS
jgi:tRNA-Thr(GGU) m(6)t(6)A37 methyltransferase TsaA